MKELKFTKGIDFYFPNENAPEFIVGTVSINPERFQAFMKEQKAGTLSLNVCRSKKDPSKCYLTVNDFVPKPKPKQEADNDDEDSFY